MKSLLILGLVTLSLCTPTPSDPSPVVPKDQEIEKRAGAGTSETISCLRHVLHLLSLKDKQPNIVELDHSPLATGPASYPTGQFTPGGRTC